MSSPTPSFADLGAPGPIVEQLAQRGITEPFPIQAAVLSDALDGRDILGRAPTGSGKTLAFGIPVVARMDKGTRRRPSALILSPTRELAEQIGDELRPLAGAMGHSVAVVYGGVGYGNQHKALQRGASLVVACPGRLEDLLQMEALSLADVEQVVVDEADRMADMGFLPAVRRLVGATSSDRQVQLFSATLDGPVSKLTKDFQREPVRHEVGPTEPDMTLAHHLFWSVERSDRVPHVAQFIDTAGSTIVFTRTRHGADRLTRQLDRHGVKAAPIHGGRSQNQRTRALESFASGRVKALVATDVAARGIHVDDVAGVVHFDPPEDAATYVHRSGRTARAGASGVVLSLVDPAAKRDAERMQRELGLGRGVGEADIEVVRDLPPTKRDSRDRTRTPSGGTARGVDTGGGEPAASGATHASSDAGHAAEVGSGRRHTSGEASHGSRPRHTPQRDAGRPGRSGGAELTGRVVRYERRRGFGFIKVKGRNDVFVHMSGVRGEPQEVLAKGNQVAFRITKGRKGDVAVDVRPLGAAR